MCNREILSLRTVVVIALACLATLVVPSFARAVTLPAGFEQTTAISGLVDPMDVEVTPAGRVFVAEKSGLIKTYSSLSDTTPTVAADLRTEVHNFSARGLMSIAVDPNFPVQPYIYVYYTLDAKIGGTPPLYGDVDGTFDSCVKANLGLDENCVVGGRISRLRIAGEVMTGTEQVLVEDYCQQYPVHAGGGLSFGADGYLYFSAMDGSTASFWDYGQTGTPPNPCGDPPGTIGDLLTPPTAEGGRLRVQDLRTPGDPTGLDGTLIRIDPRTGAGVPGNPLYNSSDANERRILAYGLRDSVRLAIRPGTNDVWIGDRGGGYFEELDRVPDTSAVRNFGWPCYEGGMDAQGDPYTRVRPKSEEAGVSICANLYAAGNETVAPYWAYDHELSIVPNEPCAKDALGNSAGSLLSGLSFYPAAGGTFPAPYRKALFFADRLRNCIFALLPGSDGLPERNNVMLFASDAMRPIDLETHSGRRPAVRRPELRPDRQHRVRRQPGEPGPDRGRHGRQGLGPRAADRPARRHQVDRPRRTGRVLVRMGPRRRRRVRRLDQRQAEVHAAAARHGHRWPCRSPTRAASPAPTRWASRSPSRPRRSPSPPRRTRASRRTTRSTTTAPRTSSGPRCPSSRPTCASRCPASPARSGARS